MRISFPLRMMNLVSSAAFQKLFTPQLRAVRDIFKKHGYEIRIAGGAVRDLVMGKEPADVDFATTATPTQMKIMFDAEGVRMLHKKGEEHGTITCRVADSENFEITTLRVDVLCDGRHADVQFTTDWLKDAARRDLTVNSLFLDLDGIVHDFFNGVEDIQNRRVRFVGSATDRIQEDYLRILRYFRFYGRIAERPNDHDDATLAAIEANAAGLKGLSGERVWSELKKIIVGGHAAAIVRTMLGVGIGNYISLPSSCSADDFEIVWNRAKDLSPEPMTMAASLLHTENDLNEFRKQLKISNAERDTANFIISHRDDHIPSEPEARQKFWQDLFLREEWVKTGKYKENICELLKYLGDSENLKHIQTWKVPVFPVKGFDLINLPGMKGPAIKKAHQKCYDLWIESNYSLTKEELLQRLTEDSGGDR